jgi:hypothetical protein
MTNKEATKEATAEAGAAATATGMAREGILDTGGRLRDA